MKKMDVIPGSENNLRNSEGSMVVLKDGRILFAYTHFYGGKKDSSSAYIGVRYSSDRGETWTPEDEIIIEDEGKKNVMSASLLRLQSEELILGYSIKNSLEDCRCYIRKSYDEGLHWRDKISVMTDDCREGNYFCVHNDRIIQISSGRILIPASHHFRRNTSGGGSSMVFFSDNRGDTWRRSADVINAPDKNDLDGVQEPGIVELKDGRILMWMRTNLGCQYYSYSVDGGDTWSKAIPSPLISPLSPASIKRIPDTGNLLVVFNDHSGRFPFTKSPMAWQGRTPLIAAISEDEGKKWQNHILIENDPEGRFCYTSILFMDKKILLSYSAVKAVESWGNMRVTVFNKDKLYKKQDFEL